jgi:hypothetical protein
MTKFWASTTLELDELKTQVFEFMALHRSKALCSKEKIPRQLVDSIQLNTMVTFYNLHFANYSLGKKQVTQLIHIVMWKQIYINYQTTYPDSYLVEETLEDILKELKTRISNQKVRRKQQCNLIKC